MGGPGPTTGPDHHLRTALALPARRHPRTLPGQLVYIKAAQGTRAVSARRRARRLSVTFTPNRHDLLTNSGAFTVTNQRGIGPRPNDHVGEPRRHPPTGKCVGALPAPTPPRTHAGQLSSSSWPAGHRAVPPALARRFVVSPSLAQPEHTDYNLGDHHCRAATSSRPTDRPRPGRQVSDLRQFVPGPSPTPHGFANGDHAGVESSGNLLAWE